MKVNRRCVFKLNRVVLDQRNAAVVLFIINGYSDLLKGGNGRHMAWNKKIIDNFVLADTSREALDVSYLELLAVYLYVGEIVKIL